jgi:hypothetical protein
MSELVFEEGFRKAGQGGMYGDGEEFNRMEMTPNQIQGYNLKNAFERNYLNFVQNKDKRIQFVREMEQIETFRYMNVEYVAASLIIIDQYLKEVELQNIPEYLKNYIFNDNEIMGNFLPNLIIKENLEKPSRIVLCKKILFSYMFKILNFRSNPGNKKETFDLKEEREGELYSPSISSPTY